MSNILPEVSDGTSIQAMVTNAVKGIGDKVGYQAVVLAKRAASEAARKLAKEAAAEDWFG